MRIDSELLSRIEMADGDMRGRYEVKLSFSVQDAVHLWTAAAAVLSAAPGMSIDDVVDVIGPPEDPEIEECIAALVSGSRLAGCALQDVTVGRAPERKPVRVSRPAVRPSASALMDGRPALGARLLRRPTA